MFQSLYKNILCAVSIALIGVSVFTIAASNFASWSYVASEDLKAAYTQLKDNHPGYCDTENPQWKVILYSEYSKGLAETSSVKSYDEYKALLRNFVRSMDDVHMGVQFVDRDRAITHQLAEKASIVEFLPECAWVRLPSFSFNTPEEVAAMQEVIKSMPTYRNHKVMVFDVRGNGGGSSEWGLNLLKSLFSTSYVDQQMALVAQKYPEVIEWRASTDNIIYSSVKTKCPI